MPSVRVKRGRVNRREEGKLVVYNVGDELTISDREYAKLGEGKVELLSVAKERAKARKARVATDGDPDSSKFDVEKASVEELLAKAEELGIEVGPRWGEKRLREAVAEALEEGGED